VDDLELTGIMDKELGEVLAVQVGVLKPIKPSSNTVFLTYLHTTYVSFIHIIPYVQAFMGGEPARGNGVFEHR
jgi:hypothetical protein